MGKIFVTTEELTAVADEIRAKGGTSAPLEWPAGYIAAVENISGGTDRGVPYLAFWCDGAFAFRTQGGGLAWDGRMEYSTDLVTWETWDGTAISSAVCGTRHLIALRGIGNTMVGYGTAGMAFLALTTTPAGMIDCEGDVDNLLDYQVTQAGGYPARQSYWAYCLFMNWAKLRTAPDLGSVVLSKNCYVGMFQGCTRLTTAPALPATTLAESCYTSMFSGCTSLTTAPELPATGLADYCYFRMFYNCTSLTTAPTLPATTLANNCYSNMFYGCTSLTTAPALPAMTIAGYCYANMFYGCTSLTDVPALPATTLEKNCYAYMFYNCRRLSVSTAQDESHPYAWRIPTAGTGVSAQGWSQNMLANTAGPFIGSPAIDTTYYTTNPPVTAA